ncbi:hypothetical protein LXL04_038751 [Taraxacum kok-saghyz]
MVKEGPWILLLSDGLKCGTGTLQWRQGPPEKPVLCNSCGNWLRSKGTLSNYTPKHGMKHVQTGEALGSGSSSRKTIGTGPSRLVSENAPRSIRSSTGQYSPTLMVEQFRNQLLGFIHEQPELYLNKPADEDMLIYGADVTTSTTPFESALGALLLVPSPREEIMPTNSESTEIVETTSPSRRPGPKGVPGVRPHTSRKK